MKFGRFAIALLTARLLLSPLSGTALAAAPSNDTFAGATPAVLGFSEMLDTTEATTDSDDTQLNLCGFTATDASVWYAFTASSDVGVVVDVSQSSYPAGVLVGVGSQGNLQMVACGYYGAMMFSAAAGTTYYVLAADVDPFDGNNGGSLSISFREVPPPPTVEITLDRSGQVNVRTGIATISGTYTCSNGDSLEMRVGVRQNVGRLVTISGGTFLFGSVTCDGVPHTWSKDVFPNGGKFAGGKAMTDAEAFVCGPFECGYSGFIEQTVQLRGGPK